jgi:hypothetical protein
MKIKRLMRLRSCPPLSFYKAQPTVCQGLWQHNGGAKVTALSFSFSGSTREARALSRIHQRRASWTFIASCENGALCYVRVQFLTFTCNV